MTLILKNVDFEDLFRLERVSHEFRYCVNEVLGKVKSVSIKSSKDREKSIWKSYFQKLPNLQDIEICGKYGVSFLKMLSQNSPKIERLRIAEDFLESDLKTFEKLRSLFSQRIASLCIQCWNSDRMEV